MLRSLKDLTRYDVDAADKSCGTVRDFYVDDQEWIIRYVVVATHKWLPGRKTLLSPSSVVRADWKSRRLVLSLSTEEIEHAPGVDLAQPVSQRMRQRIAEHDHPLLFWQGPMPTAMPPPSPTELALSVRDLPEPRGGPHLRSFKEVRAYQIEAVDGAIGHLDDLVVEMDGWPIRYAVVDTSNWLPGRKVLVALGWIDRFDWAEAKVFVDLARDRIEASPEFDPSEPVNRDYERRLYDFYGRPYHWE